MKGYGHHSFLNEYISENDVQKIMEIGVDSGDNAKNMVKKALEKSPPGKVEYYGFDTFNNETEVRKKLSETGCKFKLFKGDSRKTLHENIEKLPKMDLIFIDGGHAYEVVKSDWEKSKKLLKNDTAIYFHNYNYLGPKKVVDNISRENFFVEILNPPSDYKTALVKPKDSR